MTTISSAIGMAERISSLEELLRRIAEGIQLPPESHTLVHESYEDLTARLESGALCRYTPVVYGQGSYMLGTTVRPLGREEFDLDSIAELAVSAPDDPEEFARVLVDGVTAAAPRVAEVEPKDRCVRLSYPGRFHIDVVGAQHLGGATGTVIRVPVKTADGWSWTLSDPKAYIEWFRGRSISYMVHEASIKAAEPLPPDEGVEGKQPLQIAVQLVKRHHRLVVEDETLQTPSIVLTTIAGQTRARGATLTDAMDAAVAAQLVIAQLPGPQVWNPVLPNELLSRKWADADVLEAFRTQTERLASDWFALRDLRGQGLDRTRKQLVAMFGEGPVDRAIRDVANAARDLAQRRGLGTATGAAALVRVPDGTGSKRQTFYGRSISRSH